MMKRFSEEQIMTGMVDEGQWAGVGRRALPS